MMRCSIRCSYWNRSNVVKVACDVVKNGKLNFVTGPPSSGKTATIRHATVLELGNTTSMQLSFRGITCDSKEDIVGAFRASLKESYEQCHYFQSVLHDGLQVATNNYVPAVANLVGKSVVNAACLCAMSPTAFVLQGDNINKAADGVGEGLKFAAQQYLIASEEADPIKALQKAHDAFSREGKHMLIFIDEFAELQSKGDTEDRWKDKFAGDLIKLFIHLTKEQKKKNTTVILTSSEQQYYDVFEAASTKTFTNNMCLGYMSDVTASSYLEEELEVTDAEARNKIVKVVGGNFTQLQDFADAHKCGALDVWLKGAKQEATANFNSSLDRIDDKYSADFKKKLVRPLAENGFLPFEEAKALVGKEALQAMIKHNVIGVRFPSKKPEWCEDIPFTDQCVTPFVPIQRHTLKAICKAAEK